LSEQKDSLVTTRKERSKRKILSELVYEYAALAWNEDFFLNCPERLKLREDLRQGTSPKGMQTEEN